MIRAGDNQCYIAYAQFIMYKKYIKLEKNFKKI